MTKTNAAADSKTMAETLKLLASLRDAGRMFIALAPPFSVTIEVDRASMRDALANNDLSEPDFQREVTQAGNMLLHILNGTQDDYAQAAEDDNAKRQHANRVEDVRAILHDPDLQQRYDAKRASIDPVFTSIDWDVKVKHYDTKDTHFPPYACATLLLSYQNGFDDSPLAVLSGGTFRKLAIDLSRDEIMYLIQSLNALQYRLEEIETASPL